MFYCNDLLRKNDGKFAAIWLASVYGKNIKKILTRRQITRVDITQACNDVVHPAIRFSLRLQSNLMIGILRVYKEQVFHFCDDIKRAWRELRMTFHVDMRMIDLQKNSLSEDACTLPDPVLEHFRSPLVDDFPKDIFSISPADIFPKDDDRNEFFHVGFQSPASDTTPPPSSTPSPHSKPQVSPGPHQISKEKITITENNRPDHTDDPIVVPGDDMISPPLPSDDDDMIDDHDRPVQPPDDVVEDGVRIVDPGTGRLITAPDTESKEHESSLPDDMTTPNARIEPVVPDRPRKRKRQAVDNIRKLTDEKIKRNHLTVMDTLRDQIIDVPLRLSAHELLNNPSLPALRSRPFIDIWRQNAVPRIIPDEEVPGFSHADDRPSSDEPREREVPLVNGQPNESSDYERSRTSSIVPLDGFDTPRSATPGHDRPGPDALRPGSSNDNIFPPSIILPTILETGDDPDRSISPITELVDHGDDDEEALDILIQRLLREGLGDRDQTSFSEVFPPRPRDTTRIRAARGLYELLVWHQRNVAVLSQPDGRFSEIYIERGSNF